MVPGAVKPVPHRCRRAVARSWACANCWGQDHGESRMLAAGPRPGAASPDQDQQYWWESRVESTFSPVFAILTRSD